ncbi:hypothetical protein EHQ12_11330 [Leptospira gomenensis]|uniref:Uncharacterized protein n=1 Tax=Leptospira gomenensis TaxID=2484974 RepID=A0A5F1YKB1_9LEPT|nr:hypothetical protein [Leptospira gomenensis]TGK33339.1 hypothetical protein EHQ17_11140 [Leptospira gomenensis]TGK37366.1 hypothetical protein EHQ12_11330 [Leptospira gomenensis]TGK40555.1 hypothetical protein EHQ07_18375 [Leptospira gomenensis]TGK56477.1 hypothetical protein EHQ13_14940 [Leptospira gomenensis]
MRAGFGILIVVCLCAPASVFADLASNGATHLVRVEKGLKTNEFLIKALNSSVSNLGTEADKALYKRIIQHHVETNQLYLQFDLERSYSELKRTQDLLVILYSTLIESGKKTVRSELGFLGYYAIRGTEAKPKKHLELGYRELASAEQKKLISDNTRPYLQPIKLELLYESLKLLKQSRKYVVLLSMEYLSDFPSDPESEDFLGILNEINRAMFSRKDEFARIHFDNHFHAYSGENLYDTYWQDPALEELEKPLGEIDAAYLRARRKAKR